MTGRDGKARKEPVMLGQLLQQKAGGRNGG